MKNQEYLAKKVRIVYEHTGMAFMHKNQFEHVAITGKTVERMQCFIDEAESVPPHEMHSYIPLTNMNCPYCAAYNTAETGYSCAECPVHEAGKNCKDPNSTFEYVVKLLKLDVVNHNKQALLEDLVELAKEFVEAHKSKLLKEKS